MNENATEFSSALSALIEQLHPLLPSDAAWSHHVNQREFGLALDSIEPTLEKEPENAMLKLWWLRCQLEVATLPLAALAAPLHEIAVDIQAEARLHTLGCSTYLRAAVSFFSRDQLRLGVQMLRQTIEFIPSLPHSLSEPLLQDSLRIVQEERERAPLRREATDYLDELAAFDSLLQEKLSTLSVKEPVAIVSSDGPDSARSPLLNSKSILDAAHAESLKEEDSQPPVAKTPKSTLVQGDTASGMRLFAGMILACVILLAVFSWQYVFHGESAGAVSERLEYVALELNSPKPLAPKPEGGSQQQRSENTMILDSVSSRLEKLSVETKTDGKETPANESEVDREALDPKNAKNLVSAEDELVSMSSIPQATNAINDNNIPEMTTGRFSNTKVEDVGTSRRKTDSKVQQTGSSVRAADTPPGQAEETGEESFNPPRLYRTITPTEVLSAPSLLAKSLARLESNTPVHVTKRMGRWLQLRSTGGRTGFIYAQDASVSSK